MIDREVMQMALEALMELLPSESDTNNGGYDARDVRNWRNTLTAIRARLAEPVQEQGVHATHCCPIHGCKYGEDCPVVSGAVRPVYPQNNGCESCEHEKPAQEPVAPARCPLTDEDIDALWRKTVEGFKSATTSMLMRGFARNIERKITGGNDE